MAEATQQERHPFIPPAVLTDLGAELDFYDSCAGRAKRLIAEAVDMGQLVDGFEMQGIADRQWARVCARAEGIAVALGGVLPGYRVIEAADRRLVRS